MILYIENPNISTRKIANEFNTHTHTHTHTHTMEYYSPHKKKILLLLT